jgi:hypothetical protein
MPGKPTKWSKRAWGLANSYDDYLLTCQICQKEREPKTKMYCWGNILNYRRMCRRIPPCLFR